MEWRRTFVCGRKVEGEANVVFSSISYLHTLSPLSTYGHPNSLTAAFLKSLFYDCDVCIPLRIQFLNRRVSNYELNLSRTSYQRCTGNITMHYCLNKLYGNGYENYSRARHLLVKVSYFILSSSMDKTVRLWHISRKECLCCFQHIDFVTAIVFHPRDDRYFLSGSLDGKLRLWNIPDKKVAVWNEVDGQTKLITAANFCQNGKFAVVGSYDGRCIFYTTEQLRYHTQIHVRSTRGKNSKGRKISGIEPMPGEDKILVTSNDSRIRLYDLRDLNLSCKYKGYVNVSSQIKASFSEILTILDDLFQVSLLCIIEKHFDQPRVKRKVTFDFLQCLYIYERSFFSSYPVVVTYL
ncbi:hypothetical protein J437_LFUL011182 [Ladona fulva]|uniref:WD repeat-containing protein 44 n=1 Tax=Ladona fulva TaxID=123851 RepID=A0A8K0KMS1_LADFU|nr:hypothetical protein J437_LFUL011182 [Ladona fulva]